MNFGIFFEQSTPRPFTAETESAVWRNALEQARLADELGFDWVWAVEHHFLEEYSHCSAPEVRAGGGRRPDRAHPRRPRRRGVRPADEPPDPGGRAGRRPRPALRGTARVRHRPLVDVDGAGRLQRRPRRHQADLGRVRPGAAAHVGGRTVRLRRRVLLDARAQRAPQAAAEAPSADVGDGDQPWHRARRRRAGPRLPRRGRRRPTPSRSAGPRTTTTGSSCAIPSARWSTIRSRPSTSCTATRTPTGPPPPAWGWSACSVSPTPICCGPGRPTRPGPTSRSATWPPGGGSDRSSPGDPRGIPEGIAVGDPDRIGRGHRALGGDGVDRHQLLGELVRDHPQAEVLASMRLFAAEVMPRFNGGRR